ncbi:MAG: transcriptional regulator [Bdellovibrionaceae bacterium]|nr:transcriptional regulator [Pseudobdellovibrionaceae bacterium]|tara:strand:+ start:40 stop:372 length:333 start_codon:yes stop_codon:yes gene_type:complete
MEINDALSAFTSLSQETRLIVFRLLIEYGKAGAAAGVIAEELEMPPNTLSFHLAHLSRAGLVTSERHGRSITYFANTKRIEDLIRYLHTNCCSRESRIGSKSTLKNERKC